MKLLIRAHRYLSLLAAPAMLFFAVSGAWQAFRLQEARRDGSYKPPVVLEKLSEIHKAERLKGPAGNLVRAGQVVIAAVFATTAILGIVMAFRIARPRWMVWACLVAGVVLPVLVTLSARR